MGKGCYNRGYRRLPKAIKNVNSDEEWHNWGLQLRCKGKSTKKEITKFGDANVMKEEK